MTVALKGGILIKDKPGEHEWPINSYKKRLIISSEYFILIPDQYSDI